MFQIIQCLRRAPCKNRARVLGWFAARRLGFNAGELIVKLARDGRTVSVPINDIHTLTAALALLTSANPWERWSPRTPPKRIADLGANIGLASLYFALRFPEAEVVAVEMMPENAAAVARLAQLNGLRIRVLNLAVGDSEGVAEVRLNKSHTRHSLSAFGSPDETNLGFTGETMAVPIVRLSRMVLQAGWPSVDLLKIDIEGAEALLLADIKDWAALPEAVFLEIHHNVEPQKAEATMIENGFVRTGEDRVNRSELWFSRSAHARSGEAAGCSDSIGAGVT